MKKIVEIQSVITPGSAFRGKDSLGKQYTIYVEKQLRKGQSVLLNNGVFVGVVQTTKNAIYEV